MPECHFQRRMPEGDIQGRQGRETVRGFCHVPKTGCFEQSSKGTRRAKSEDLKVMVIRRFSGQGLNRIG